MCSANSFSCLPTAEQQLTSVKGGSVHTFYSETHWNRGFISQTVNSSTGPDVVSWSVSWQDAAQRETKVNIKSVKRASYRCGRARLIRLQLHNDYMMLTPCFLSQSVLTLPLRNEYAHFQLSPHSATHHEDAALIHVQNICTVCYQTQFNTQWAVRTDTFILTGVCVCCFSCFVSWWSHRTVWIRLSWPNNNHTLLCLSISTLPSGATPWFP